MAALYVHGLGVPQDNTKAAYWYKKAWAQGDIGGELGLNALHAKGRVRGTAR